MIRLSAADTEGGMPLTHALASRRSVRAYTAEPVRLADLSQLLWAAQGVTQAMPEPAGWQWGPWPGGLRTAPSAGALYPLELYVSARAVDDLEPGLYHYRPREHALERVGDCGPTELAGAALGQRSVVDAAAVVVVAAVHERTAVKYGERATRYVDMEAGAAAENLLLQAAALSLGAVYTGSFDDDAVHGVLRLPEGQAPLALLPIGHAAADAGGP
jgi:SagB-type dehydrogenase family enzyme